MIRRPPRSTRTDTLFPYTTLFRSEQVAVALVVAAVVAVDHVLGAVVQRQLAALLEVEHVAGTAVVVVLPGVGHVVQGEVVDDPGRARLAARSEERRVGKECVRTCSSRLAPYHEKKKTTEEHTKKGY